MKPKITISDSSFLQYEKSFSVGGTNTGVEPTYFEWEPADPQNARFVTDAMLKHARGEGQIALLLESFFLHPEDYITAMQKNFDYVLTHNQYFAQNKNWLWYAKGGSWINLNDWGIWEKNKGISMLLSLKETMPGHKLAHAIARKFEDRIDIFGLDGWAEKQLALRSYKYSIVIEAERTAGFFSEKLIDCFAMGTLPIYWGDPNLKDIFYMNGIMELDDFDDVQDALIAATHGLYHSNFSDIMEKNKKIAKDFRISEDWIYNKYPFLFGEVYEA